MPPLTLARYPTATAGAFEELNRRLARGLPRILVQALRRGGKPV
jgi:hypothetical protein